MIYRVMLYVCLGSLFFACREQEPTQPPPASVHNFYYPPGSMDWESRSMNDYGWNTSTLNALDSMMEVNGTRAFLILKDGYMVYERYWGKDILGQNNFGVNSNWYWASAGKTLSAFLCGIAQEQGALALDDAVTTYLGSGWTSMADSLEQRIRIRHQLTMTTGLDYEHPGGVDCTDPGCLTYRNDPGTTWFYHNAPYTLLSAVISAATQKDFNSYTDEQLQQTIGMNGSWIMADYNHVYWSTARDAARFGLLLLSKGSWNGNPILHDSSYFQQMVNTSQDLNPSYGYLTWLNGKSGIIPAGLSVKFNTSLAPSAPADLYAAMGKNGQFIDVIPSKGIVVVRMGTAPDNGLVPALFHDQMWKELMKLIP